jgi:hypothetical protein
VRWMAHLLALMTAFDAGAPFTCFTSTNVQILTRHRVLVLTDSNDASRSIYDTMSSLCAQRALELAGAAVGAPEAEESAVNPQFAAHEPANLTDCLANAGGGSSSGGAGQEQEVAGGAGVAGGGGERAATPSTETFEVCTRSSAGLLASGLGTYRSE